MDHSNRRMQQHHKRQRVTATTETTVEVTQETSTSINTRLYKNRTATELATATETPTTAVTTAEETTRTSLSLFFPCEGSERGKSKQTNAFCSFDSLSAGSTRRRPVLTSTDTSTPASSTCEFCFLFFPLFPFFFSSCFDAILGANFR